VTDYQQILVDHPSARVARITLNRPDKLNAMTEPMLHELIDVFGRIKTDSSTHVVILRGAGRSFCAGHDVNELPDRGTFAVQQPWFLEQQVVFTHAELWRNMFWSLAQPVIAAVQGYCLTIGIEWAMNCDLVYVADDLKLGLRMAGGSGRYTHLLPWLVGVRKAKELMFTGHYVNGEEAVRFGIANAVVPAAELDAHVLKVAEQIARVPLEFLAIDKQATNKCLDLMGVREAIEYSDVLHAVSHLTPAAEALHEGIYKSDEWRKAVQERDSRYAD
jgi:enoyl-CoA hydratase